MKKVIYVLLVVLILGIMGMGCIGGDEVGTFKVWNWEYEGSGNLVSFNSNSITVGDYALAYGYSPYMYFVYKVAEGHCKIATITNLRIGHFYYVYKLKTCIVITDEPKENFANCRMDWDK